MFCTVRTPDPTERDHAGHGICLCLPTWPPRAVSSRNGIPNSISWPLLSKLLLLLSQIWSCLMGDASLSGARSVQIPNYPASCRAPEQFRKTEEACYPPARFVN